MGKTDWFQDYCCCCTRPRQRRSAVKKSVAAAEKRISGNHTSSAKQSSSLPAEKRISVAAGAAGRGYVHHMSLHNHQDLDSILGDTGGGTATVRDPQSIRHEWHTWDMGVRWADIDYEDSD